MPQQVVLSYVRPDGTSGAFSLDATVEEQHGVQAQVTDHPVETGSNVTDFIRPLPRKVSLHAWISNTPVVLPQDGSVTGGQKNVSVGNTTWTALQFDASFDRVHDVYNLLIDGAQAGALWTIATTLEVYADFALTNVQVPRDAARGNILDATLEFQEILTVQTQTVAALAPKKIAKTSRGQKPAKEADDEKSKQSRGVAVAILQSLGVLK